MSLRNWLIYENKDKNSGIQVRKVGKNKEIGIEVSRISDNFPFSYTCETFLNKEDTVELIKALMKYFGITTIHILGDKNE